MPSSAPSVAPPRRVKSGIRWPLVANVALLFAIGVLIVGWRQAKKSEAALRQELERQEATAKTATKSPTEPDKVSGTYRAYGTPGWSRWINQLRASGVPDAVIARIVIAESQEDWDQQDRKSQGKVARGELSMKQYDDAMKSTDAIQENAIRAALGDSGFLQWDMERTLRRLGLAEIEMTDQERTELYTLQRGLTDERAELELQQRQGLLDPSDYSALQEKAYLDTQAQMKKLLGDNRYAIAQNGGDPAMELRRSLGEYKPTDQQFQQMIEAQKQWSLRREEIERAHPDADAVEDKKGQLMQALDNARKEAYKKALGAEGYAAFQKQQDSRYLSLKQYAPGWGLTPESVETLYTAVTYFEKTIQDAHAAATAREAAGQKVDWEEVNAAEEQVKTHAEELFRNTLGPEKTLRLTKAGVLILNSQPDD